MGTKKRRKRKPQNNMLVLKLLILVVIVLILFEGKLIYTMFTQGSSSAVTVSSVSSDTEKTQILENELSSSSESTVTDSGNSVADAPLAGLSVAAAGVSASAIAQTEPETEDPYHISEEIDSPAVVKEQTNHSGNLSYQCGIKLLRDVRCDHRLSGRQHFCLSGA